KELVIARSLGDLSKESYLVMLKTLCGRLCASLFASAILPRRIFESLKKEFIEVALESGLEEGGDESVAGEAIMTSPCQGAGALMSSIFKRILRTQEKKRISRSNSSLKDSL
ncbi:Mediator of RNA polymerase II transcription subunit 24like, partial [Caligus rogercresseyi]